MQIKTGVGLSFDDVLLRPAKGVVSSRTEVNLEAWLVGDVRLSHPIVSSPMPAVTEGKMAKAMYDAGGYGFIHRFMPVEEQVAAFLKYMPEFAFADQRRDWCGCAVGLHEESRIKALSKAGCKSFILDIAHGATREVEPFMASLPKDIRRSSYFISGSVATGETAAHLASIGFDAIRVGIGNGAACTTRSKTGIGVPQVTAIMECREAVDGFRTDQNLPIRIVSDGGINTSGDIVKALAAGANSVMSGRLLAGSKESPKPGRYWGAASKRAGKQNFIEGDSGRVKRSGSVATTIESLLDGIRSGISYAGGDSIRTLHELAHFQVVLSGTKEESKVRL